MHSQNPIGITRVPSAPHRDVAQRRLTHKYVTGWSHLDAHEDQGWRFKVLGTAIRIEEEGYYGLDLIYLYTVVTSRRVTRREIYDVMSVAFERSCQCEHDCCGHYHWHVGALKLVRTKPREWVVPVYGTQNL